jgi:beta-N-acetylhexosaminidase
MTAGLQGSLMVDVAGTWLTAEDRQLLRQPEVGGLIILPATSSIHGRCVS